MNRVEKAAANVSHELKPLDPSNFMAAPVLTPVALAVVGGAAAGAVVGYVHCNRHGCLHEMSEAGQHFTSEIREMSINDLLQARQDTMAG